MRGGQGLPDTGPQWHHSERLRRFPSVITSNRCGAMLRKSPGSAAACVSKKCRTAIQEAGISSLYCATAGEVFNSQALCAMELTCTVSPGSPLWRMHRSASMQNSRRGIVLEATRRRNWISRIHKMNDWMHELLPDRSCSSLGDGVQFPRRIRLAFLSWWLHSLPSVTWWTQKELDPVVQCWAP